MTPARVEFSFEMRATDLPMTPAAFRRDARTAVAEAGLAGPVSIAVVGDETMRRVNRDFHDVDETTDVLAFSLGESAGDGFRAEVVVSLDTARREAKRRGVKPSAELMLYVVHGLLHLAGYDDHSVTDARTMHARTLAILDRLGHRNTIRAQPKPRGGARGRPQRSRS